MLSENAESKPQTRSNIREGHHTARSSVSICIPAMCTTEPPTTLSNSHYPATRNTTLKTRRVCALAREGGGAPATQQALRCATRHHAPAAEPLAKPSGTFHRKIPPSAPTVTIRCLMVEGACMQEKWNRPLWRWLAREPEAVAGARPAAGPRSGSTEPPRAARRAVRRRRSRAGAVPMRALTLTCCAARRARLWP